MFLYFIYVWSQLYRSLALSEIADEAPLHLAIVVVVVVVYRRPGGGSALIRTMQLLVVAVDAVGVVGDLWLVGHGTLADFLQNLKHVCIRFSGSIHSVQYVCIGRQYICTAEGVF